MGCGTSPRASFGPKTGSLLATDTLQVSRQQYTAVRRVGTQSYAAMTPGGTAYESTQLNIESLWSGGPFQDPVCSNARNSFLPKIHVYVQSYNGGNKQPSERAQMAQDMQNIHQTIFQDGTIDSECIY